MMKKVDEILLSLFNNKNIEQLDKDELEAIAEEHPYSSFFQLVYALKTHTIGKDNVERVKAKTALHFPENLWAVDIFLNMEANQPGNLIDTVSPEVAYQPPFSTTPTKTSNDDDNTVIQVNSETPVIDSVALPKIEIQHEIADLSQLIPIDPYHTVDYFASQGIKLSQIDHSDQLGIKVKSFTAWLKTMKKMQLPASFVPSEDIAGTADEQPASKNELIATEAMAEVYLKQGLIDNAIAVYTKLSLQNPGNSHIFASKISAIKENLL